MSSVNSIFLSDVQLQIQFIFPFCSDLPLCSKYEIVSNIYANKSQYAIKHFSLSVKKNSTISWAIVNIAGQVTLKVL